MEIKRVDPYALKWSADGVVALATESAGLQLLCIESNDLLASRLKWKRTKSSLSLSARVIDMQWSPTLMSSECGCLLVCILDTGEALVLEIARNEVVVVQQLAGPYTAACWLGNILVLSDDHGTLHGLQGDNELWTTTLPNQEGVVGVKICGLAASRGGQIGVATTLQQCWLVQDLSQWQLASDSSTHFIDSIAFNNETLVVLRCGTLQVCGDEPGSIALDSFRPGVIFAHAGQVAVIHSDGTVFGSPDMGIPRIQGDVAGASVHPTLPMAVLAVTKKTSASLEWDYPILSRESINLAVFPLSGELHTPRRVDAVAEASWLALFVKSSELVAQVPERPVIDRSLTTDELPAALERLFYSPWFDYQRLRWYKADDDRIEIRRGMIASIAEILTKATPETALDKLIVSFYSGELHDAFALKGDFINDEFEANSATGPLSPDIVSKAGRVWKRCALTLLPLLTLDTQISSEGEFISYRHLPSLDNDTDTSINPVAEALLASARFCVFTGTNWTPREGK